MWDFPFIAFWEWTSSVEIKWVFLDCYCLQNIFPCCNKTLLHLTSELQKKRHSYPGKRIYHWFYYYFSQSSLMRYNSAARPWILFFVAHDGEHKASLSISLFWFIWRHWIKLLVSQCKSKVSWSLAGVWHLCGVTGWWHLQLSDRSSYLGAISFSILWAVELMLDFDLN